MMVCRFNQNYNSDIYIINSDGTNIQNITNSINLGEFQPLFYPNGSKILFILLELGKPEQFALWILIQKISKQLFKI